MTDIVNVLAESLQKTQQKVWNECTKYPEVAEEKYKEAKKEIFGKKNTKNIKKLWHLMELMVTATPHNKIDVITCYYFYKYCKEHNMVNSWIIAAHKEQFGY